MLATLAALFLKTKGNRKSSASVALELQCRYDASIALHHAYGAALNVLTAPSSNFLSIWNPFRKSFVRCGFPVAIMDLPVTQSGLHAELPDQVVQDAVGFVAGLSQHNLPAIITFLCQVHWNQQLNTTALTVSGVSSGPTTLAADPGSTIPGPIPSRTR